MTTHLAKNAGKALFPHLSREKRKKLLAKIIVVLMAGAGATIWLLIWMLHAVKQFKQSNISFTDNF